jgi:hypothetical protein
MIFKPTTEIDMRGGMTSTVMAGRSRGVIRFNVNLTAILLVRSLGRLGCRTDSSYECGETDFIADMLKLVTVESRYWMMDDALCSGLQQQ